MNYVVLSEVAKIIMGQSPPSSTYNVDGNGLPFFQGKADFGEIYPRPRVYCSEPIRIAEPGDVLITVRAPVGPTNLNPERSCIGRGLSAIRVGTNIERNYLFYFLRYYEPELAKAGTGSTFAAISREGLETIKLPLPPLPEQQRIAAILQKADRLRRLRRYARQLSDGYLQSVFLEMFGDPLGKSRIFPVVKLGDIVRINPSLDYQVNSEMDVSFIPMAAIDEASASITSPEIHKLSEVVKGYTSFQENDVLFAKITPCMENGKSAIARNLHNFVGFGSTEFHVLRPTDQTNSEWLLFLVRDLAFRSAAKNAFTGTAGQQRVPTSFLENYKVKKPQEGDLEIFRNLYEKHFGLTIYLTESERQAEQLFQSLLHQAFEEQDR